jgi:TM2 domain-containing membrane protein YozV
MDNSSSNTNTTLIVVVILILIGFGIWFLTQQDKIDTNDNGGVKVEVQLPQNQEEQ